MLSVVVREEFQRKIIGIRRVGRGPARREIDALAAENAVRISVSEGSREIRFPGKGGTPLCETHRSSRINHVGRGANAGNAERDGLVRLNERRPDLIDRAGFTDVRRVPVVAVNPNGERLLLGLSPSRSIRAVGVGVNVEHVDGAAAGNFVLPIDLVQPPGEKINAGMCAFVVVIRAIPVIPPAATHRSKTNRFRVPTFEGGRLGNEGVAHLVVGGGSGMNIALRAAPNVDLIVHVVEVRSRAECGGQRGRPLVAVEAPRRVIAPGLVKQRHVGIGWIRR